MIHLLFNRAEAKDSIHELNAAEQTKENMKLKDQIMAKDVEISLLKESLIENGNFVYNGYLLLIADFGDITSPTLLWPIKFYFR